MAEADKQRPRIFLHRGQLDQAKACYEHAVQDDRAGQDESALSDSLGNLGNVCAMSGDFDGAELCYREVLVIQRRQQNLSAVGQTLVNLGNVQMDADRPDRARPYYLEARDLLEPPQDHRALGLLYHKSLARGYERRGARGERQEARGWSPPNLSPRAPSL